MKSSLLFVTALFLPDVFAAAVPSKPREFKHRELPEHKNLLPRRAGPLIDGPSTTPTSISTSMPPIIPADGPSTTPADGLPPAPTSTSTFSTTTPAGGDGYLPPDPAQSYQNSLVGGHPFRGHGPAIATPISSSIGMSDTNVTFAVLATGTVPPIANATATIYAAPTADCPPQPVPEAIDSNGNFLPTDQQPGYNGSVSTNGTVPGNCPTYSTTEVIVEGHMQGETEVVEIDIIPLPNNSTLNTFYGAGFSPSGTPTSTYLGPAAMSTTTGPGPAMSSGRSGPIPDAGNPGFTGPRVRNMHAV